MLELSDLFNQINLKNSRNTSPNHIGKHHLKTNEYNDESCTKESGGKSSGKINKETIEFVSDICSSNETI